MSPLDMLQKRLLFDDYLKSNGTDEAAEGNG